MKSRFSLLAMLITLVSLVSCTKEFPILADDLNVLGKQKHPHPVIVFPRLIKTSTTTTPTTGDTLITSYQYDEQGRLSQSTSNHATYKYSYYPTYYVVTGNNEKRVYYLSGSKQDSLVIYGINDTSAEKYIRDANQQLIMVKKYSISRKKSTLLSTVTNIYSEGNLTKTFYSYSSYITYTYTNIPFEDNRGMPYGDYNKNYTDSELSTGTSMPRLYIYSYQFDDQKRLTRKTFRSSYGVLLDETYTY